ncbi:MAG: hypothetical protein KKH72_10725 [Alphaproteobacteria bacterium]|nr:hypothetical protein [Alphaproteobacteria bacterium]
MRYHDMLKQRPRRAVTGLVLAAALAILPAGAGAETITDFAPFVYDTATPQVLRLNGEISVRTPLGLNQLLRQYPNITTIELSSPGGSVYAALTMAPDIRDAGLTTVIPAGAQCFSACAYLFFAGVVREAGGELGVHQVSAANLASGQFAVGDIVAVLDEFNVPAQVLVKMLQTPAESMYVMSPDEMERLGLLGDVPSDTVAVDWVPPPVVANPQVVGMDHNGSSMWFDNLQGTIYYVTPKSSMQATVSNGTVLFRGAPWEMQPGAPLSGTAYTFRKGCQPAPYAVTGLVEADRIVLRGNSPIREKGGCAILGYTSDSPNAVLVFTLAYAPG